MPLVVSVAYLAESEKYDSSAVTRLRRSDFMAVTYAFDFVLANFGIAIAAKMPMMTTTISSSMSVKPLRARSMVDMVRMLLEESGGKCRGGTTTAEHRSNARTERGPIEKALAANEIVAARLFCTAASSHAYCARAWQNADVS